MLRLQPITGRDLIHRVTQDRIDIRIAAMARATMLPRAADSKCQERSTSVYLSPSTEKMAQRIYQDLRDEHGFDGGEKRQTGGPGVACVNAVKSA
jgi:hypothetical protein